MSPAPLLLLHAAASSSAQWKAVQRALGDGTRVIAPDLYGDGRSPGVFPPPSGDLLAAEMELLRAIVADAGGRAHFVGHSYGAVLALRMALAHPEMVESLLVIEPVLFDLLVAEGDVKDVREVETLRIFCEEAVHAGDDDGAAERFVDYWAGAGTYRAQPEPLKKALGGAMTKVAFGWREIAATPADYSKIEVPTTVLKTSHGPKTTRWIAARLADRVPGARSAELTGAGHLAPVTHPAEVAHAIEAHLEWCSSHGGLDLQRVFFDRLAARDVVGAASIFDDNAVFSFPGVPERKGRAAIERLFESVLSRFETLRWVTEPELYAPADFVISRWHVTGTYKTGKAYANDGVSILRRGPNGKILHFKDYFTSTDFSDR